MELDEKLHRLPLTRSHPKTLESLFGNSDVSPMWVADMEFQIAQPIQEAIIKRVTNSGFGYEYKPESFYSAQKEWYHNEYKINLDKNHILYSPTITTTIAILIEEFTRKEDGIIIQPPVFMEFKDVIRKTGRRILKNPLKLTGTHYAIDFEDLEEKAKLESSKILIICNPHNPVGRVWTRNELDEIIRICEQNGLLLVADEIHKDIVLFNNQFTSLLRLRKEHEKLVVCTSEAKSFNLCSLSDSMAIIPNEDIRQSVSNILKKYNLGRTNALTRVALEAAYKEGAPWLKEVLGTIEKNVKSINAELQDSNIDFIPPEGTYQVWLDFRKVYQDSKEMFNHLTVQSGIAMNAGHWFGREGAMFMRMNIATSNHKIVTSIRKIKNAVPVNI